MRRNIRVKIGILSMQRVDNMGSLLQAYALKTIVEKIGHQVEFIDIERKVEDYELLGDCKQTYSDEREANGNIGKVKKIDQYTLNRLKNKRKCVEQGIIFEKFRKENLSIENVSLGYDVCIIGSDEVFNCLDSGEWGFTSQLFGNVPGVKKVITYAASCGSTKYEELPAKVTDRIRQSFENVAFFSARDKNTHEFVAKLTHKCITDNLDPVLIYDFAQEMKEASLPDLPAQYCVVYSYYNRIHTSDEIKAIKSFCKKHQLIPVAVGAPQFWIKNYIVCSPFQCLKVFQKADFVVTDTFHGTIFASKYADRFATMARESNRNKLVDLVGKIGMQNHLMDDITEIDEKYSITKEQMNFESIIESEKRKSLQYLKESI